MRLYVTLIVCVLCVSACKDRVICPAFQSTYILDDSVRSIYYSYLWKLDESERTKYLASLSAPALPPDSTDTMAIGGPIIASTATTDYFAYVEPYKVADREVKKNKYGMVRYEPYWLGNYRQKTAPMENVLTPPAPVYLEPEDTVKDVGEFLASDFMDSLDMDTSVVLAGGRADTLEMDSLDIPSFPDIVQAAPPKQKFETQYLYNYDPNDKALNVEQAYYNKYFGQYLYKRVPVVEAPPVDPNAENSEGLFNGFFQRLFSPKVKVEPTDSLSMNNPPITEEPPVKEEIVEPPSEDDGF